MKDRRTTSFRLSADGRILLDAVANKLGIDKTAVLEIAIRKLAEIERVSITPQNDNSPTIAQ